MSYKKLTQGFFFARIGNEILIKYKMKQIVLGLILTFGLTGLVNAQSLPGSATSSISVVNISQGNKDATQVGVRAGDALRYELIISSDSEDVTDYVAQIDISGIQDRVEIIDITKGRVEGGKIIFDSYSHSAPCEKKFSFFVRFKDCSVGSGALSISSEGKSASVATSCSGGAAPAQNTPSKVIKLPSTGPSIWIIFGAIGMMFLYGIARLGAMSRR